MNIEQKQLINIIREELAEALGMDQQFSGATPEVEAENSLSQALLALKAAGYTREEVIEMVDAEYELQEDLVDDPTKAEEAEAKERAAQGEDTGSSGDSDDDPGEYVPTSEGSRSRRYDPRNYVGRDVGRRFTHGSDGKKPPTGLYGKRKYFKIK